MSHRPHARPIVALLAVLVLIWPGGVLAQSTPDPAAEYVHVLRQVVALLNQPPGTHNLFVNSPDEPAPHLRLRRERWDLGHRHAIEMFEQAGRLMDPHFTEIVPGPLPSDAIAFIKDFLLVKLPPTAHADEVTKAMVAASTALNIMTAANMPTEALPLATARPRAKPTQPPAARSNAAACTRLTADLAGMHRILETTKRDGKPHAADDAVAVEATFLTALESLIKQTAAQRSAHCR